MKKNTYFEQMRDTAIAYNEAQAIREKNRDAMIAADNWDSVKAFDEREKAEFPYPFTSGQNKALVQYDRNLRNGADAFEIDDLPGIMNSATSLKRSGKPESPRLW